MDLLTLERNAGEFSLLKNHCHLGQELFGAVLFNVLHTPGPFLLNIFEILHQGIALSQFRPFPRVGFLHCVGDKFFDAMSR